MMLSQIRKLRPGDEVFWNDPDGGKCSRVYKVQSIEMRVSVCTVIIVDVDGSTVECFAGELS